MKLTVIRPAELKIELRGSGDEFLLLAEALVSPKRTTKQKELLCELAAELRDMADPVSDDSREDPFPERIIE